MFFHMLRQLVGDTLFYRSLQDFYKSHLYRKASFADIRRAFEKNSGLDLRIFFQQWVQEKGAPTLRLQNVRQSLFQKKYRLQWTLLQTQSSPFYTLLIPIVIEFKNGDTISEVISLSQNKQSYLRLFTNEVDSISIDPQFDLFRKLYEEEIPPSVSKVFGETDRTVIVLPTVSAQERADLEMWALSIQKQLQGPSKIVWDDESLDLKKFKSVWVLGIRNSYLQHFTQASGALPISLQSDRIEVSGQKFDLSKYSAFATVHQNQMSYTFVSAPSKTTLLRSAQKIPHYGKFSYLIFKEEANILKGEWTVLDSPLRFSF
ncbi:MAG: hypothetical protein KDD61_14485 [Bdellovibrionales bacterium]|nr:hypothetical protein [Bdellovibrionales bacterium]